MNSTLPDVHGPTLGEAGTGYAELLRDELKFTAMRPS